MSLPASSKSETTRAAAWQRLVRAAPPDWVLRHCLCVESLAVAMATQAAEAGHDVDAGLVARGALLHDIGRSVTQGLEHAYRGADLLREPPTWPEPIVRCVETHTGAGVVASEAQAAGLPKRDFIPRSLEERIVAHADNLYSGDKRRLLADVLDKYEARGLHEPAQRIAALHRELEALLGCDLDALEPASLPTP